MFGDVSFVHADGRKVTHLLRNLNPDKLRGLVASSVELRVDLHNHGDIHDLAEALVGVIGPTLGGNGSRRRN
jgi:hypothetical protein